MWLIETRYVLIFVPALWHVSYHHRGPCDHGSPVTLGGTERSEALTSIILMDTVIFIFMQHTTYFS